MDTNLKTKILDELQGTKVCLNDLGDYQQWALQFFHDVTKIRDPYLQVTVQLDITNSLDLYQKSYSHVEGARFTSFLYWMLNLSLNENPSLKYRRYEEEWYQMENLPIYTTVALNGDDSKDRIRVCYICHCLVDN